MSPNETRSSAPDTSPSSPFFSPDGLRQKQLELEIKASEKKDRREKQGRLEKQNSLKLLFEAENQSHADLMKQDKQITDEQLNRNQKIVDEQRDRSEKITNEQTSRRVALFAEHERGIESSLDREEQEENKRIRLQLEHWKIEQRRSAKKKKQQSSKVVQGDAARHDDEIYQMSKSKLM